jgi:hypothetical protein
MNARTLQQADAGTPLEVPAPVLFNTWKHHAGALRWRSRAVAEAGPAALVELGTQMAVLGTKLMDLYTGRLWPAELCAALLDRLRAEGRLDRDAYRSWLAGQGGYGVVELPQDASRWVLRLGDDADRYLHLHPGRWSPNTVRVKANVLKTAFLVQTWVAIHGGDPLDRAVINAVRGEYLGLPPLGADPDEGLGLGAVLTLLRGPTGEVA